jgi:hypothetical protein
MDQQDTLISVRFPVLFSTGQYLASSLETYFSYMANGSDQCYETGKKWVVCHGDVQIPIFICLSLFLSEAVYSGTKPVFVWSEFSNLKVTFYF